MTVEQLLSTISIKEYKEWEAFSQLEPFGPREELRRIFIVVCAILNTTPMKEGHRKVYKPEDFLLNYEQLEEEIYFQALPDAEKNKLARESLKGIAKTFKESVKQANQKGGKLTKRVPRGK